MSEDVFETDSKALLNLWEEIRTLSESMDLDIRKHAVKGNHSAGLRSRRGLRLLKKLTHELLMASVDQDKKLREAKQIQDDEDDE